MPSKLLTMCKQALTASNAPVGLLSPSPPPLSPPLPPLTPSGWSSQSPVPVSIPEESDKQVAALPGAPDAHIVTLPPQADTKTDSSVSSHDDSFSDTSFTMSTTGAAECLHAEPRCIPLLTTGMVTPVVMQQWEMACVDSFRANKKIELNNRITAVLPGLKDMRAWDWVATYGDHLASLTFTMFIIELQKEFLPDGWDDELHTKILNSHLKASDSFPNWVNNICHLNIVLWNTKYYFSDVVLWLQLDSPLDSDLQSWCKNHNVKEVIKKVTKGTPEKTKEAWLTCWIGEVWKLAEEHMNDTKRYLEAAEDLQCMPKCQALANHLHNSNTVGSYKAHGSTTSSTASSLASTASVSYRQWTLTVVQAPGMFEMSMWIPDSLCYRMSKWFPRWLKLQRNHRGSITQTQTSK